MRLHSIQQTFGGKFHVASLCGCHFPVASMWFFSFLDYFNFTILLSGKENKCFLMSLFVPSPTQKSEQRFGICTRFSIFYKKDFHYAEAVWPCNTHCQALLRAQYHAKPPTCIPKLTGKNSRTHWLQMPILPPTEGVYFLHSLSEKMKLQLLNSSKNEKIYFEFW